MTDDHTYKIVELAGTSSAGVSEAIRNGVARASQTLRGLDWVEVSGIRGHIENYQNNLQFIIDQCWPAKEGTYEIGDLVPHTDKDIDAMCHRVTELLGSLQNRHVAALVQAYLDDEELMKVMRMDQCLLPLL